MGEVGRRGMDRWERVRRSESGRRWTAVATLVGTIVLMLGAGAGTPAVAAGRLEPVGAVPALLGRASVMGTLPARKIMRLTVALKPRYPDRLAALASAISQPGSPSYGRFLPVAAFARRFGASPAVVASVRRALRAEGIHVGHISANGLAIPVSGRTAQVEHAFATAIAAVRLSDGRLAYGNRTAPKLPAAVARYVQDVFGLDDLDTRPGTTIDRPAVSRSRRCNRASPPAVRSHAPLP